jgi:hypothetical protein
VIAVRSPVSPRLGDYPSFYRPRREQSTCVPHYFPTCGGMASSATELTAVLVNPPPAGASWCVLCSYRSNFEGGGVVVGCLAAVVGRFEGAVDGGPIRGTVALMATSCPCALQQHRDVITVPGVVRQWRGWPRRVDRNGDDRSCRHDVTAWPCVITEKAFKGPAGPPFEGSTRQPYGGRRHSVTKLTPASSHSATQRRGWPPQGVGETARGHDSRVCQGRGARPAASEH